MIQSGFDARICVIARNGVFIRATRGARNVFADLEEADEAELKAFAAEFREVRKRGVPASDAVSQAAERREKAKRRKHD